MISQSQMNKIIRKNKKLSFYKLLELLNQEFDIALFEEQCCELGKGSFGKCFLGKIVKKTEEQQIKWQFDELVKHNRIVAIKVIDKQSKGYQAEKYHKQVSILASLQRQTYAENILKIFDFKFETQSHYYIMMEYCNNSTLYDLIENRKSSKTKFTIFEFIQIMLDIVNGYQLLKKKDILHLDLKPQNILIKNKIFKIGDFGLAMKLNHQNSKKVQIGTWIYASPQQLTASSQIQIDHKSDMFALGLIFYEILFGKHPYYEQRLYSEFVKLKYRQYRSAQNLSEHSIKKKINLEYLVARKEMDHPQVNIKYEQKYQSVVDEFRDIVIKMCSLDKAYRCSLKDITERLSKIHLPTFIQRSLLFPDLTKKSKSYLNIQIEKMTKYAVSIVETNPIEMTINNLRQTQVQTVSSIIHMKRRIQITLQYLAILHSLNNVIRQYLLMQGEKVDDFQSTFYDYCCDVNMQQYRRSLQQWKLMSKQQERIADRQNIEFLMLTLRQNDCQFQRYTSFQIYQQKTMKAEVLKDAILSQVKKTNFITSSNTLPIASLVLLYQLIEIKQQAQEDTTNRYLKEGMLGQERYLKMIGEECSAQGIQTQFYGVIDTYMDKHKINHAFQINHAYQ